MLMLSLKNFFAHPDTTIGGALLGALQAAVGAATSALTQTGGVIDWKPCASAAIAGATTFIVGGLMSSIRKTSPAAPAAAAGQTIAPGAGITLDPKQQIMDQIEAALTEVAHAAMAAEASKLSGVNIDPLVARAAT